MQRGIFMENVATFFRVRDWDLSRAQTKLSLNAFKASSTTKNLKQARSAWLGLFYFAPRRICCGVILVLSQAISLVEQGISRIQHGSGVKEQRSTKIQIISV